VLFVDLSNGFKFVTRSCAETKEMGKTDDGLSCRCTSSIPRASRTFYTGTQKWLPTGGVDKFFKVQDSAK
jgi:large subunit ribosomal protein L31